MTNDEWEKQRHRSILAAFQTGRPVFGDSEGVLRYDDGDREQVPADVGIARQPVPRATALAGRAGQAVPQTTALAVRAARMSHRVFIASIVAAVANGITAIVWRPSFAFAAVVFAGSAVAWRRINRNQRAAAQRADAQDPGASR